MAPRKGQTKEPPSAPTPNETVVGTSPGVIQATQPTLPLPGTALALGVMASAGTLVVTELPPSTERLEGLADQEAEDDDGAEERGLAALNQMHEELQ